jgi:O-antigen/teichoic acid export membrane protein
MTTGSTVGHRRQMRSLAKGGTLNLLGAGVYGASSFAVLWLVNRALGPADAGVVLLAIAAYNIISKVAELGCSTGLVRWVSRARATHRADQVEAIQRQAIIPVAIVSACAALALFLGAETVASWFSHGEDPSELAGVLRAMAPFLPMSSLHSVIVQGTRGFGTMLPQVAIEKIGRAVAMPLAVAVGWKMGATPAMLAAAWALTATPALFISAAAFRSLTRRAVEQQAELPEGFADEITDNAAEDFGQDRRQRFWKFTGARAIGQTFEVGVNWVDTLIIGALLSTTQAGIYASGTRYVLLGSFTADAVLQVCGPSVASSLANGETAEANRTMQHATGWQTLITWPIYLLVFGFASPLLGIFGESTLQARPALLFLAAGMMIQSLAGPASTVILMDGKSTTALFNTVVSLGFNIGGNLWAIPRYGISGAGAVWALTLLIQGWLPAFQARWSLRISTFGRPGLMASLCSALSFGLAAVTARSLLGESWAGLATASILGTILFVPMVWTNRKVLALEALIPQRLTQRWGRGNGDQPESTLDTTAQRSRS